jgi:two-component system sensor histidine kinase KdpD
MYHSNPSTTDAPEVSRGTLRVYLGAAPGVGKTYAMLREGHRLKAEGRDVVIGFVESHGRIDTERQLGDLEVVPRQVVRHGGIAMEDMDLDAIVQRAPDVVLVDELAHTNPPGAVRPKRYLDVEELLRWGIDVISTVNVQHLEGMTGIVGSITGVGVRETIPDEVLDEADEVLLVDLPVSALIDRLEAGKIYPGARADQALTGFFQEGNLTALRELALRRTAEGVDDRLSGLMLTHGDALVAASDRVLVLVDADERWGSVLRAAWRLASAFRGDVLAVVLAPDGSLEFVAAGKRDAIGRNLSLAEDLGAEVLIGAEGSGSRGDIAEALAHLVRLERVSVVVLGQPRHRRRGPGLWRAASGSDLAQVLIERVAGLEVHLVGYAERH